MDFDVREMRREDVGGAVALQSACFPAPFPEEFLWKAEHLERHLEGFPQGQFVAVAREKIVGSASSLIISEENWQSHRDWDSTVGGPFLANHDPSGSTLYGVDISVHPEWRGKGLGRALYRVRFDLVEKLRLRRYGTACRLPGYAAWQSRHGEASVELYVAQVSAGTETDRTLSPLLRYGLGIVGVIHGYMQDEESGNAAALLERSAAKDVRQQ